MNIGFISYDSPAPLPTTQELLASLTFIQKSGILNGFASKKSVIQLKTELNLRSDVITFFYVQLKEIEMKCKEVMNDQGASSATNLRDKISSFFTDFTSAQLLSAVNKIVAMSKSNGTGDWSYYSTEVIS